MAVNSKSLHEYMRNPPDCSEDLSMYINAAKVKAKAEKKPAEKPAKKTSKKAKTSKK